MRSQILIFLFTLAATLLTACSQDTAPDGFAPPSDRLPVTFGYYAARTAVTRAQDTQQATTRAQEATFVDGVTNRTIPKGQCVGIFGFYQGPDAWTPKKFTADFMYNQPLVAGDATDVTEKAADGKTTVVRCALSYVNPTDQRYWPNTPDDKLAFIAYYPWNEAPANNKLSSLDTYIQPDFTKGGGIGAFRFKVAEKAENQLDFMVSDSVVNQTKPRINDRVRLTFHHALSAITATVTMSQDLIAAGGKITNMHYSISGVRRQGTCKPTVDNKGKMTFVWKDLTTDNATFTTENAATDAARCLVMIPQPLSNAKLTITYDIEFHETVNGQDYVSYSYRDNVVTFDLSKTSGGTGVSAWRPGLRYNYNVIVSLTAINFTPSIRPWTTGTMETDLNK